MKTMLADFQKATKRLEEALSLKKNEITRDSAIMRFQIVFDLAWKLIKVYARSEGLECYSPKNCFQTALQLGLIDYDERWLEMINDRNLIIHTYTEEKAENIYKNLKDYLKLFQSLANRLEKAITEE